MAEGVLGGILWTSFLIVLILRGCVAVAGSGWSNAYGRSWSLAQSPLGE